MKEVNFEITQWAEGQSLDIAHDDYSITLAGTHGGGVGEIIKRFRVNIDSLEDAIAELCGEEDKK